MYSFLLRFSARRRDPIFNFRMGWRSLPACFASPSSRGLLERSSSAGETKRSERRKSRLPSGAQGTSPHSQCRVATKEKEKY